MADKKNFAKFTLVIGIKVVEHVFQNTWEFRLHGMLRVTKDILFGEDVASVDVILASFVSGTWVGG